MKAPSLAAMLLMLAGGFAPGAPLLETVPLFEEGKDGFASYRIPGIVVTAKGTALAYCEARKYSGEDWGELEIHLRRSTDGGRTWSSARQIAHMGPRTTTRNATHWEKPGQPQGEPDQQTVNNPVAIAARDGTVHFVYCIEYMRAFHLHSKDDGITWSKPVEITSVFDQYRPELDWQVIATGPGHALQLQTGRLVVPFWMRTTNDQAVLQRGIGVIYSDDDGRTWSRGDIALRDGTEPNIAALPDGRVMVTVRNGDPRDRRMATCSRDGVSGWSPSEFIEDLPEHGCIAGMVSHPGAAGTKKPLLLFSYPNSTLRDHKDRVNLTIKASADGGRSWPVSRLLQPGPCAYSDLAVLPDGTILCLYESGTAEAAVKHKRPWAYSHITLARFNLEWLTARRNNTRASGLAQKPSGQSIRACADALRAEPSFAIHYLFDERGARDIITTKAGTVLAFHGNQLRESANGGATWSPAREISPDADGKVILNETTGEILLVQADKGVLWKSRDNGQTWARDTITILPNGFGHGSPGAVPLNVTCFQPGVTLQFGNHRGRLLLPGRILGPSNSNDVEWRPYHYNTSMFSDDGGTTWQVSAPFPVLGSGEGALAELSDGRILYSSREHMSVGNRWFGWSRDGGELWTDPYQDATLPDGARGTSYGCMGGLIRLPIPDADVLLYSNLDSDGGVMPKQVGGSTRSGRERITVWASFDGARSWPVKRLVYAGPSAYSNLGVGRAGTPSEGKIFLHFEGGERHCYEAVYVAVFNLSWLLEDRELRECFQP
jgi:sialidase-1